MTFMHIANTNFEFELQQNPRHCIKDAWSKHSLCLQLQFLPLLFAECSDSVAITDIPTESCLQRIKKLLNQDDLAHLYPLQEVTLFEQRECLSWGPSQQIQQWALQRNLSYDLPQDWNIIQKINSKDFSFLYSPFKESCLITNEKQLLTWLRDCSFPVVLKTCFGLSGTGHLLITADTDKQKIIKFCKKEWAFNRPLVAEPWLARIFDFSTQWVLSRDKNFKLLGATVFQTQPNGRYLGTFAGPPDLLFGDYLHFLHEHILVVKKMLNDLGKLGYFGHVGVDALIFWCKMEKKLKLYPIVEINGRKTLSLVALLLQQKQCCQQILHLSFQKASPTLAGLLPNSLGNKDFAQNLVMQILPSTDYLQNLKRVG